MTMKRSVSVLLSLAVAGSMTACSGGANSGAADAGKGSADAKNKKITITWFSGTWENPVPGPDSEAVKAINEKFNVDFKPQYVPWDTYDEKLSVTMASGDIPDVIGMELVDANYMKWAKQGAFLPLNDYLDKYNSFKPVPSNVWDMLKVNGKVYAVPYFFNAKGGKKPVIRKDWLDKLGLPMPTNYEELKKVAIAFAKQDPDGNGKDDTIGLGLAKNIYYSPTFSPYYGAWYEKDKNGQYIPDIGEGSKEVVKFLADLYKEGAIKKDWAVTNYNDVFKAFNAGKVGIWYEEPGGNLINYKTLAENAPNAVLAPLPAFKAPDGTQGIRSLAGYYKMYLLSAKLKNDPEKVQRILEIMDYFREFTPADQRNAKNEKYDWLNGKEGKGYKMEDGVPIPIKENRSNVAPSAYINTEGWAPNDQDLEVFIKGSKSPLEKQFNESVVSYLKTSKIYLSPVMAVQSPLYNTKWTELSQFLNDEKTKMIVGQRPFSDWDKMVDEFMAKGGKEVVDEVNKLIKDNNAKVGWQ
ncbi:ABC transporter substrate-binding protein [Paenibacillus elgii]|uniref:ABC transporter substrate-binding protein n=1 Tax=Paenibacillus elgii TaxID=189691 RepID=A0A165Q5Q5_9BACL|nr:extracellular solute-binding protein [Paenibacillus elgii]KZE73719.1 ABC transporter substrate-binding protein [Paenibacillus elgii]